MASSFPLVIQSGKQKQLQSGDVLLLQSGGAQATSGSLALVLNDNTADALSVAEGSNVYLDITTSNSSEAINIGNASINNALSFLGTGQVTFSGNVDATNGLDVTTAALTAAAALTVSGGALSHTGAAIDFDPTAAFTLDMDTGFSATITVADNQADAFLVQQGANAYIDVTTTDNAEAINLGNATTNPTLTLLGTGTSTFGGDVVVTGDLTVSGTTTTVDSETVNIADNHLYLNNGYTADAAQTGGMVVNYDPTTTTDTSSVAPPTSTTITTAGSGTFTAGDYIQISGGGGNDGIYRVLTHTGTTLTIATSGDDFIQTSLDTGDATAMTLYHVGISVLRAGTDGTWETASGNTGPLTFSDLATATGVTLQQAYDNDPDGSNVTVTMNSTDGKIIWAGDQDMQWATSGTADFDSAINSSVGFTNSAGEMLFSGGNLQLNDSINLTLGTGDDLTLSHSGTASSIVNSVGALTIENNAAAANIIVELGDNAAATSFVLNDSDSVAQLTIDSNGQADFTGNVDANAGLDVSGGSLTATGGTFTFTGTNIDLDPTGTFALDMDAAQTATITLADLAAALTIQAAGGEDMILIDTDSGNEKLTFGNATFNNGVEFLGSGLVDIANGTLDIPAGASLNIGGTAGSANLTGTNLNTLVDGGNADALHTHANVESSQIVISGLTTTGLADGDAGYISAADTMTKTDATAEASSRFFGFNEGTAGSMTVLGLIESAKFTTDGGSPGNGSPVYLALGTADTSTGAGKLTATAPTTAGQFVAEVGLCLNNANYSGSKTAEVLIQPKAVVAL